MKLLLSPVSLIFTLIILLLPLISTGQSKIWGRVLNQQTKAPIEDILIITNTGKQALTDPDGRFHFTDTAQSIEVTFQHLSFYPHTVKLVAPIDNGLEILLQPHTIKLHEVVVKGYETYRPLLETAGAISILGTDLIQRFDESSLVRTINTVPGVRMEERTPASYRIAIRGSSLRSPYGIRNVKIYLNDIPLTGAKGTTDLNLLDAANIGHIEILKGPAGSIYGAGTGGTIVLTPHQAKEEGLQLETSAIVGSFGLKRYAVSASHRGEKSHMLVQYAGQSYAGFREQSAMDRKTLMLNTQFYPSAKQTVAAFLLYSDLYYELPGGLTREQYDQNPRQARGGPLGSVLQNASMNLNRISAGITHEYKLTPQLSNTTALYGFFGFQDHPFNTDYERNARQEYGGRTKFTYHAVLGRFKTTLTTGAEFQQGFEASRTYDNQRGKPGALRSDDEVTALTGFIFSQADIHFPTDWIVTAALSLNDTRYRILRLHQISSSNEYFYRRHFNAVLSPRLALLKKINNTISVHSSISAGFSPPTEEELLTSDGQLNQSLEAEKGLNYEAGIRGHLFKERLQFDVTGFSLHLRETIVSRQETSSVAVFRNAGATLQNGLESSLHYALVDQSSGLLRQVNIWSSYTFSHFRFTNNKKDTTALSGNKLTGVAPHVATLGLDIHSSHGFYLNLTTNYVDAIPLTDENTVFSDPYWTMSTRAGYQKQLHKQWILDLFAGVDNLTNEKYSLGNDLNAFGKRYYQPAPPRNFFGGIRLKYLRTPN